MRVPSFPDVEYCSVRVVDELSERLSVRQGVVQPYQRGVDRGLMVTVVHQGGLGYAATSDVSDRGLAQACAQAVAWARAFPGAVRIESDALPHPRGQYATPITQPWDGLSTTGKIELLRAQCDKLRRDSRMVDWEASLWRTVQTTELSTNQGGRYTQKIHALVPQLSVSAHTAGRTETRSLRDGEAQQGGLEVLDRIRFLERPPELSQEVLELLDAPDCPVGTMDVLLAPDQMMLQIHESIGHPLELDRILGDERNYAGTSFVTLDMFGSYRYGSNILNVSFDPSIGHELASYGFDDDGSAAELAYIIRDGILLRPLGGAVSQARAQVVGVANARASGWNRPAIDRMANLNLESSPDTQSFEDLVSQIDDGVLMRTNRSWSIDDSRNKFQFGCEWGRRIEHGKLTHVVRQPNYRGVSATFWRNLQAVGGPTTVEVLGTPYCGKGEPNQCVRVGHASPPCVFSQVQVFGGT